MIGLFGILNSSITKLEFKNILQDEYTFSGINIKISITKYEKDLIALVARDVLWDELIKDNIIDTEDYFVIIDGYISSNQTITNGYISQLIDNLYNDNFSKLHELNGEFNLNIYSKKDNIVHIINDRLGSRPIYYMKDDLNIFWGNERKVLFRLTNKKIEYSPLGLFQFLHFGHLLRTNDLYKSVNVIAPATVTVFEDGNIKNNKYWNFEYTYKRKRKKANQLSIEMGDALKDAGKRVLQKASHIGLGLSGGLDSRVIAGSIPYNKNIFARTFGQKESREVIVATNIASTLGFEHYIEEPKNNLFSDFIYLSVWRTEGVIPFMGLKSILSHHISKDTMWYNLGGQVGDVLTGKTIMPYMLNPFLTKSKFIDIFFEKYIIANLKELDAVKGIFNPVFYEQYYPKLVKDFKNSFDDIRADNICDLYVIWDLLNRQTRFTLNSNAVDNHVCLRINLFTDVSFIQTALEIKPFFRFGQLLYKKSIFDSYPQLRGIINSNMNKRLKGSHLGNLFDLGNWFIHLKYLKKEDTKRLYNKAELIRSDKKLYDIIIEFVNSNSFPVQYLSKEGILHIIEDHYYNNLDHSNIIGLISTLAASNHIFIENNRNCYYADYLI